MEKIYNSEEEFLKDYDSNMFEKLSMTTDIAIFSVSNKEQNNYRKLGEKKLSVLLIKRDNYPFKDKWCLPGGFLDVKNETLDDNAKRILENETNIHNIYIEQLYTFSDLNRDPRMRVVSTSYMALIDKNRLNDKLKENASWFDVKYTKKNNIIEFVLTNGKEIITFKIKQILKELTTDRYKYTIMENNDLAFDHPLVIISGIERLKNKIEYTDIVFNMMPEYFTLGELQQVYEVILNKELLDPAFRRIIADKVTKTDKVKTGGGHRPSALFKYNDKGE